MIWVLSWGIAFLITSQYLHLLLWYLLPSIVLWIDTYNHRWEVNWCNWCDQWYLYSNKYIWDKSNRTLTKTCLFVLWWCWQQKIWDLCHILESLPQQLFPILYYESIIDFSQKIELYSHIWTCKSSQKQCSLGHNN